MFRSPDRHPSTPADPATAVTPQSEPTRPPGDANIRRTSSPIRIQRSSSDEPEVNRTRIAKIPPFWKDNPALWFAQIEAAFVIAGVRSDDTKFRYVILHLEQSVLPLVSDIVTTPPEQNKYSTIKDRVIHAFGETTETKLKRLLRGQEFPDEKPSILLHQLRNLAGDQCPAQILCTIFMEHLPENVCSILAVSESTDIDKIAIQADKILEVSKAGIAAVTGASPTANDTNMLQELKAAIEALTIETRRSRNKERDRHVRSRSNSRQARSKTRYCFYHNRFGARTRKCTAPCAWKNGANQEN